MLHLNFGQTSILALLLTASCLTLTSPAHGQESLRWKLQEGQQFDMALHQEIVSNQEVYGQNISTVMDLNLDYNWIVDQVDDEGIISMTQSPVRIRMDMTAPNSGEIHVDTDNEDEGEGGPIGSQIQSALDVFVDIPVQQKINSLGEVIETIISEEDREKLVHGAANALFTEDSFEQMLRQSNIAFPEGPLSTGDTWESEWETITPFGLMINKFNYTLAAYEDYEGIPCAKIELSLMNEVVDEENSIIVIQEQESHGVIYFAIAEGRILASELEQTMTMDLTTDFGDFTQVVESSADMTLTLKDE